MLTNSEILSVTKRVSKSYGDDAAQHAFMVITEKFPEMYEKPQFELEKMARLQARWAGSKMKRRDSRYFHLIEDFDAGNIEATEDSEPDNIENYLDTLRQSTLYNKRSPEAWAIVAEAVQEADGLHEGFIMGHTSQAGYYRRRKQMGQEYLEAIRTA